MLKAFMRSIDTVATPARRQSERQVRPGVSAPPGTLTATWRGMRSAATSNNQARAHILASRQKEFAHGYGKDATVCTGAQMVEHAYGPVWAWCCLWHARVESGSCGMWVVLTGWHVRALAMPAGARG